MTGTPSMERPPQEERWHTLRAEEAVAALGTDGERGLSAAEAAARLERFGPNALPETARRSLALGLPRASSRAR